MIKMNYLLIPIFLLLQLTIFISGYKDVEHRVKRVACCAYGDYGRGASCCFSSDGSNGCGENGFKC